MKPIENGLFQSVCLVFSPDERMRTLQ